MEPAPCFVEPSFTYVPVDFSSEDTTPFTISFSDMAQCPLELFFSGSASSPSSRYFHYRSNRKRRKEFLDAEWNKLESYWAAKLLFFGFQVPKRNITLETAEHQSVVNGSISSSPRHIGTQLLDIKHAPLWMNLYQIQLYWHHLTIMFILLILNCISSQSSLYAFQFANTILLY